MSSFVEDMVCALRGIRDGGGRISGLFSVGRYGREVGAGGCGEERGKLRSVPSVGGGMGSAISRGLMENRLH